MLHLKLSAVGASSPTSLSVWVNRNTFLDFEQVLQGKASIKGIIERKKPLRHENTSCRSPEGDVWAMTHANHIDRIAQPSLTRVNKQIRSETLPIFYSAQAFLFTLFDRKIDSISILEWLRTIGKQNASFIRDIKIVYRKKKDRQYIMKTMLPIMKRYGVSTEAKEGVLMAMRLVYPFCYCERYIRHLLGEG